MQYHFNLHDRPFQAIKNKTKKIEGRAMKDENDRYKNIRQDDIIVFENEETHEVLTTVVLFVHHYDDVKSMLETEGAENILSNGETIEQGIESYNIIGDYKERIKKFGIYAIGIKVI